VALGAAAGTLLTVCGEVEDRAALVDRATALNPNLAWLWNYSAYARLFLGRLWGGAYGVRTRLMAAVAP
jgi:hypothetical protein